MTSQHPFEADLGPGLTRLTTWTGESPRLWERAIARASEPAAARPPVWRRPIPGGLLATCGAVLLVVVLTVSVILPSLGKARMSSRQSAMSDSSVTQTYRYSIEGENLRGGTVALPTEGREGAALQALTQEMPDRQVIRKATVELKCADVRGSFLKAQMVVRAGSGEYVEDSSVTGTGSEVQAHLTLRVGAARLGEALNELRALGEVTAEQQGGEDVTAQAVDLDARLRNEHRVEEELLQLLAGRTDADLKDVLELRQHLGEVRERIEQLTGQQQRLSRMVSLATVLVILRPEAAPAEKKPAAAPKIGAMFKESWRAGRDATLSTLAWLVTVLVGGAVWWVLLVATVLVVRMRLRRAARLRGELV